MRFLLLAVAVLTAGSVALASAISAQAPPARFFGTITIDGQLAPTGTTVLTEVNERDCGSGQVTTNPERGAGFYIVDAASEANVAGCAGLNRIVFFRVGTRYAAEIGCFEVGKFTELNLTISGVAPRPTPAPGQCGSEVPPSPEPTPAPTPTATPAPPPPPAATPFSLSVLDMGQPCIPVAPALLCDAARQALWTGDQAAWRARFEAEARPAPTADDVFVATLTFRVEAGDPATIGAIAEQLGWAHVRIIASRFRGVTPTELDEWVEVKNLGGGAQDMSGWSVRIEGSALSWRFADGFILDPGVACKFYTGTPRPDSCSGSSSIAERGVLDNNSGTISLWVNFLDLKANEVRYNADPAQQPPPPNLQGFS